MFLLFSAENIKTLQCFALILNDFRITPATIKITPSRQFCIISFILSCPKSLEPALPTKTTIPAKNSKLAIFFISFISFNLIIQEDVSDKTPLKIKNSEFLIPSRFQTTGSYEALPIPGGPRKIEGEDLKRLKKLVKENPDATLQELIDKGQFKISVSGLHRILRREKITYKKNAIQAVKGSEK